MKMLKKLLLLAVSASMLSTSALASSVKPISSDMGSYKAFDGLEKKLSVKITTDLKHKGTKVFYITEDGQAKQNANGNVRGVIYIDIDQLTKKSCYISKWRYEGIGSVYGLNVKSENGNNLYVYPNGALSDENLDCFETSGSEPHINYIELMLGTGVPDFGLTGDISEPETPAADNPKEDNSEIDTSINLKGQTYAYIFGYEPKIALDENGKVQSVSIEMAPDGGVTVEEVCAMLMRLLDQSGNTKNKTYPVTDKMKRCEGAWYERGYAYLCSVGAFDERATVNAGPITRGQIAKFIACALQLNLTSETNFTDIESHPYKEYIQKVYRYGYMSGKSDTTFEPNAYMTRAEFCQLFNNILGKSELDLIALDENGNEYEIVPEDYHITDMSHLSKSDWKYKACMKATSAFNSDKYVDLKMREDNIRNKADKFDSQKLY